MNISKYTPSELEFFREKCKFVGDELLMFELLSRDVSLEEIAEILNVSMEDAIKVYNAIYRKIIKVL